MLLTLSADIIIQALQCANFAKLTHHQDFVYRTWNERYKQKFHDVIA